MADVTINYEGNAIATMSASGTKTLLTQGKYCTDDIEVVYVSPGGGGLNYTVRTVNVTGNTPTVPRDFTNFIFVAQVDEAELPETGTNLTTYYLEFLYVNGEFIRKVNNKALAVMNSTFAGSGTNAANLTVNASTITFTTYSSQNMYHANWNILQVELPNDFPIYSFISK